MFVGRITRQKGLPYLLRAPGSLPADVQLVLCAGAPDTPEIMAEVTGLVDELREDARGRRLDRPAPAAQRADAALLTAATAFVCPSVYEPLGIVNLEAMACGAAVVGTATGGIPEVVDDGVTGVLVPIEQHDDGTGTPLDPDRFVADLAEALTRVVSDPQRPARWAPRAVGAPSSTSRGTRSRPPRASSTNGCSPAAEGAGLRGGGAIRPTSMERMASTVLQFQHVSVVRDGNAILDDIDWSVDSDERWVILGPNGAGKTTLLQIAAAAMHPTSGSADVLQESLGKVDVFELRPMIGFASTAMARRIPRTRRSSTSCSPPPTRSPGRWNEEYEDIDDRRAQRVLASGASRASPSAVSAPLRRRAEARADRPIGHDRPRAAAARRARREPRPRRARGAPVAARRLRLVAGVARDRHGHPPRRGDPRGLHHAMLLAGGKVVRRARSPRPSPPRRSPRRSACRSSSAEADGRYTAARAA